MTIAGRIAGATLVAIGVSSLLAACGGSDTVSSPVASYCHAFARDWPTLARADSKVNAAYDSLAQDDESGSPTPNGVDVGGGSVGTDVRTTVREQLRREAPLLRVAAAEATALAAAAPRAVAAADLSGPTSDPQAMFRFTAASLNSAARGDTAKLLASGQTSASVANFSKEFGNADESSTGCAFTQPSCGDTDPTNEAQSRCRPVGRPSTVFTPKK
jgi:hypothetical protein